MSSYPHFGAIIRGLSDVQRVGQNIMLVVFSGQGYLRDGLIDQHKIYTEEKRSVAQILPFLESIESWAPPGLV